MSEAAAKAVVSIALADFAVSDQSGKVNAIGEGIAVLGIDPVQGLSNRFTVIVGVWLPSSLTPIELPVELALSDSNGSVVQFPGTPGSPPQAIRVANIMQFGHPTAGASVDVNKHIGSRAHMIIDFGNGLPLVPNGSYSWRVELDGDHERVWSYPFAVAGPPAAPVIG